jgi:sulfotransferase
MTRTVHFISGLPRAGSTLLSAILRQNPHFHTRITSPVFSMVGGLQEKMSGASEFVVFFDDDRRRAILRGAFDSYYYDVAPDRVVFDTNRAWTSKIALLLDLFPGTRIICCVREVAWIVDSMERMLHKNPQQLSRVYNFKPGNSVYSRADTLMNSESGLIGIRWSTLREAWFSEFAKHLIVVNYESLVHQPALTIQRLYQELHETPFAHDFQNVSYDEPEYDAVLGMPGMHKVRPKVEFDGRTSCIPPELFAKYADLNFWLKKEANVKGVTVI